VPQLSDVSKSVESDLADIDEAAELVNVMEVRTQQDLVMAVQMTATVKESYKEIDDKRETWVKPLKAVISDINATFSPALAALEAAESILKKKIENCIEENEKKRIELLTMIFDTPEDKRGDVLAVAEACTMDKVPGLSIRRPWKGEVVDRLVIIQWAIKTGQLQFLEVNEKALNALTTELKGQIDVPGWEAKEKRVVAITTGKVKNENTLG
jgi:hypothetical protein